MKSNLLHYIKSSKILLFDTKGLTLKDEIIYLTLIPFIFKFIITFINHHSSVHTHHLDVRFPCKIKFNNVTHTKTIHCL